MSELCCGDCERQWRFSLHCGCFWGAWPRACVQDFEMNGELKLSVICLLEEVLRDPDLLPQERKATANILRCPTCGKCSAHEWSSRMRTFESSFTELLCISKLYLSSSRLPPPSFYCHFILLISWSSILIYSELLFFCLLSCSVLSKLFSSAPVPFLKMSRTTPSWGSRTSCRWWATFPLTFIFLNILKNQILSFLRGQEAWRSSCQILWKLSARLCWTLRADNVLFVRVFRPTVRKPSASSRCRRWSWLSRSPCWITLSSGASLTSQSVSPPAASDQCCLLQGHFVLYAITENKDNQVHHGFFSSAEYQ